MNVRRLNVMISEKAKEIIIQYQKEHGYNTLDEATNKFIIESDDKWRTETIKDTSLANTTTAQ